MSQHFRPSQAGMPLQRPGGIQPTQTSVPGMTGSPVMYGAPHVAYNVASRPSMQGFMPSPGVYQAQVPNTQGGFGLVTVPSNVQRMYVPIQQVPGGHAYIRPTVAAQMLAKDPAKILEEQRRLEKERNFQLQQQRLKQFTVAGKKSGSSAEHLLESLFGKPDVKKSTKLNKSEVSDHLATTSASQTSSPSIPQPVPSSVSSTLGQGDVPTKEPTTNFKQKMQRDPKELESMMMKYSNLSGSQKAKTFQKPLVKDISKTSHSGATFVPSEKAVDWSHLSGLDNVFTAPKPRFPSWCRSESVPQLFHEVAKLVTHPETQTIDTNRLHAIFVSSGLPQKLLAEIWEMVNRTLPGSLTLEEMYAALALIAVAQAGHQVTSVDILHRLPACPAPVLKCFVPPQPAESSAPAASITQGPVPAAQVQTASVPTGVATPQLDSSGTRPTTLVDKLTGGVSTWKPFMEAGSKSSSLDDDFDEFKSATPMAVNIPPLSVSASQDIPKDDFDEFKQADPPFEAFKSSATDNFASFPPISQEAKQSGTEDLMSPEEDKYSIFRILQQSTSNDAGSTESVQKPAAPSVFDSAVSSSVQKVGELPPVGEPVTQRSTEDQDEFGEFLDAKNSFTAAESNVASSSSDFVANFADFSKLNGQESTGPVAGSSSGSVSFQAAAAAATDDSEFSDFASFRISAPPQDTVLENPFHFAKDNISLAESQSVSSLEFGTFDTKSSLSRQGSIPSLDLKGVGVEVVDAEDDEFGDMQCAVSTGQVSSSSSSIDVSKSPVDKPSVLFQPTISVPLADKYSVIRSDQVIPEDQHISDWIRCVQGCLSILQTGTKIFNQMSCSSVCSEVLSTEEGKNYVKNIIEVYRVVRRVSAASKSYEKLNNKLQRLLEDADQAFNNFSVFLTGSPLMPSDESLDFSPGVLKISVENNEKACGVCLLNVDAGSKAFKQEEKNKLFYGGRQYHSPCANLWVNCVDPLLPMLTLPQLI